MNKIVNGCVDGKSFKKCISEEEMCLKLHLIATKRGEFFYHHFIDVALE